MTDGPTVDDLQRENAELRSRIGELTDGLRSVARRHAAREAGLDPEMARWVTGDTLDEALADARQLAAKTGAGCADPTPPASPEAEALQQHMRESHDSAVSLADPNPDPQED